LSHLTMRHPVLRNFPVQHNCMMLNRAGCCKCGNKSHTCNSPSAVYSILFTQYHQKSGRCGLRRFRQGSIFRGSPARGSSTCRL